MELKVIAQNDELSHVALAGRLDVAGVSEVEVDFQMKTWARKKSVIIDLSEVTFVASLGMRMLLRAARELKPIRAKVVLLKPQHLVEETLKAAFLDQILHIARDEGQALQIIRGQ